MKKVWLYYTIPILLCLGAYFLTRVPTTIPPEYSGKYGGKLFDIDFDRYAVSEDFVTEEMKCEIDEIASRSEIDYDQALEIAMVVLEHHVAKDFFDIKYNYVVSYHYGKEAYVFAFWEHRPGILSEISWGVAIRKQDGMPIAFGF